jgi:DnaJ family protein A protein 5
VWKYFSSSCYTEFNDSEKGFYTVYREVFEKIKSDEQNAYNYDEHDENDTSEFVKLLGILEN